MSFAATESVESNDATFETFDNLEEISADADNLEDDWGKPESEPKQEKVSEDLKVIKDSQTDYKGKVIKEDSNSKDEDVEDEKEELEANDRLTFDIFKSIPLGMCISAGEVGNKYVLYPVYKDMSDKTVMYYLRYYKKSNSSE